jgi:putative glutamine amidotransferase
MGAAPSPHRERTAVTPPVVGLPTYHPWAEGAPDARAVEMRTSYCRAVVSAGGAPLLVPLIEDGAALDRMYGLLDGLLLCGGGDVAASFYGRQDRGRLTIVDPVRDRFEIGLTRRALTDGIPVLAICRGIQLLNVALGGTLVQDIPSECPGGIRHATPPSLPPDHIAHVVDVEPGSRLARALGLREEMTDAPSAVRVNSRHHQAVARVAPGYVVSARAPDGIIEAMEPATPGDGWVLGVQWHPENMVPADAAMASLFRAFVGACRG